MQRSVDRILTTHTGSLPRGEAMMELLQRRERNEAVDPEDYDRTADAAVRAIVARQVACGLDIVNDGEQAKPSYVTYVIDRVAGFGGARRSRFPRRLDSADFPDWARANTPKGLAALRVPTCDAPLEWHNFAATEADIARLRRAVPASAPPSAVTPAATSPVEAFMTAASPGVISVMLSNTYYPTNDDYLDALADVMRREYEAIVAAGFVLQIDCPDLAMSHNSEYSSLSIDEFKQQITKHVAALNAATSTIDPERMRMHVCWGNYNGPHNHDIALEEILPIVLQARPAGVSFEAANPRHAHEWKLWRHVELPAGKVIIPGVLDTTTNYVEHPALVAERIIRYAEIVGRERVIAGADCGFGSMLTGGVDGEVAWAKLRSLVEGAALASAELY